MPLKVLAHKPALRPDSQLVVSGVLKAGLGQFNAHIASLDLRRDAGMRENDDVIHHDVVEHGQVSVNGKFEAMFFGIVRYFRIFSSHAPYFMGFSHTDGKYFAAYR